MSKFLSRKFFITLLGMIAIPVCKALGHGLDPSACQNIAIMVGSYLLGQSAVDAVAANSKKSGTVPTPP